MFKKTGLIAAAMSIALCAPAFPQEGSGSSEQHLIFIQDDGYFPEVTYADPGDTARFINASNGEHEVIADDESWGTGPMMPNDEVIVAIESGMKNGYRSKTDAEVSGAISFQDPPLE